MDKIIKPTWPAPANVIAMTTLKDVALSDIKLPETPLIPTQVHGNAVLCLDMDDPSLEADGVITSLSNRVCLMRTADCLPVFICDKHGKQVAVVHCGWRSLAANILIETCKRFLAPMSDCLVWLGPAIGPNAFEVGEDVLEGFKSHGWTPEQLELGFKPKNATKWLGDLYSLARSTLQQQGIPAENIYGGEWCTYSDPARFYSYRRSKDTGRMFNIIWRTD